MEKVMDWFGKYGADSFYADADNIYALNIAEAQLMQVIYHCTGLGGGGAVWNETKQGVVILSPQIDIATYWIDAAAEMIGFKHINTDILRRLRAENIPLIFIRNNRQQLHCLLRVAVHLGIMKDPQAAAAAENVEKILSGEDHTAQMLLSAEDLGILEAHRADDVFLKTQGGTMRVVPYLPHSTQINKPHFITQTKKAAI